MYDGETRAKTLPFQKEKSDSPVSTVKTTLQNCVSPTLGAGAVY